MPLRNSSPSVSWIFICRYNSAFHHYVSPDHQVRGRQTLRWKNNMWTLSQRHHFERLTNLYTDLVSVYPWGMEQVCTLSAQAPNPDLVGSSLQVFPSIQSQILPLHHLIFELPNLQHNPNENTSEGWRALKANNLGFWRIHNSIKSKLVLKC